MAATWSVRPDGDGARRVVVAGELDLADEESFVADVAAMARDGAVLLDLDAVRFIDSSGVRAILRLHLDHGDRVHLATASDVVNRVLKIAGVNEVLDETTTGDP